MALSNRFGLDFDSETVLKIFLAHLLGYWLLSIVYARTFHSLAKIPGPFWPSISRTWLMYRMYLGDLETHQRALHERCVQTPALFSHTDDR